MYTLNRVQLIGNLGADPEFGTFATGSKATFSVATTLTMQRKDGQPSEITEWHDCIVWGKLSELVMSMLQKGTTVFVEGRLTYWMQEKQDGSKVKRSQVTVSQFIALKNMKPLGYESSESDKEKYEAGARAAESFTNRGVVQPNNDLYSQSIELDPFGEASDDLPF